MDPAAVAALRQQLIKQLGIMATGAGGDADVFSQALAQQEVLDITTMTLPAGPLPPDVPDSDEPQPASEDL
jgi:hypothetical protein